MKPIYLLFLYVFVVSLPLLLAALSGIPPRPFYQELASGLGMLAFSIILMEFVLSGRFKSISNGIGMDVTMRVHQVMARTALVFALIHPFLYGGTPSGGQRPWDPTRQLTVTTDFADLSTGIAAFLVLPTLVLLAVGRSKLDHSYETWRLMHGVGALLVALLLLHHSIYAGRYGSRPEIVWLWSIMTGIAVCSLLYVYLVVPLLDKKKAWTVASVIQLTPRQWEVSVTPLNHSGLDFRAGQFVWLNIGNSPFSLKENPFSISSASADGPNVSFMIKELGDFTRSIRELKVGTKAYLDGPYGTLCVDDRDEPGIALIAGGVGLAPLIGILRQIRLAKDPRDIKIIYGNRLANQIAYRTELDAEDVTYVLSEPDDNWDGAIGLIDSDLLDAVFTHEEFRQWVFVMCGPAAMMNTVEDHLLTRGAEADRILSERFDYD